MQVGILQYRTRNADGSDTVHDVGAANDAGLADVIFSHNVDSVTFGACLSPAPGGLIGFDIISSRLGGGKIRLRRPED
jgi:hypothetical protein